MLSFSCAWNSQKFEKSLFDATLLQENWSYYRNRRRMKRNLLITGLICWASLTFGQLQLNEFTAANYSDWNVGTGWDDEYEDWIELYNPTGAAIDAGGYFLSDDPTDPQKFEIPNGNIVPAGGYLAIICTGFYEVDPMTFGYLNTTFRITQTKPESVIFADPTGVVLSEFTYIADIQPNQMNHSYGRSSDGAADWVIFTNPSPGAANGGPTGTAYAQEVTSDIESGYYGAAINVALSTPEPGATIYYTTNGDRPTNTSNVYAGPINLNTTTTLRAIAYSADGNILPSNILTNTYFFGIDQHTIPVVNIAGNTLNDGAWNGDELTAIEFFDENGAFWVESTGDSNEHGNDSNAYGQRGFDFVSRDQMGQHWAILAELFNLTNRDDFQRLIFKAAANDNYSFENGAHIRDAYVHTISELSGMKLDERTSENCIVYINGQYWGVYEYREKVDDVDYTLDRYNQPRNFVDFLKTWGGTWEEYGSGDDWYDLVNFITTNDMSDPANYDYVTSVYNQTSLIDYMILNSYIVSMDWLNWNTAWWRGRHPDGGAKRWRYALWDSDASFGHYINYTGIPDTSPNADPCDPEGMGDVGGQGHVPVFNALLDNPDFQAEYYNRWASMSNTYFSCDYMIGLLDEMTGRIAPEMQRQVDRWGGTYAGWEAAVQEMRDFIEDRCNDTIVEGMTDCYDVEPATVTIIIDGIGEVNINEADINQDMSPWDGIYWIDVPITLEATTDLGVFLFWEVQSGNVIFPDPNDPNQEIIIDGDVVLIAHFAENLDPQLVMFDVQPAGAGDILMDGNIMGPYPNTLMIDPGTHDLDAVPTNEWFVFDHWEVLNANPTPDEFALPVEIYVAQTDTVIAVFTAIEHYTVTVDVQPAGAGTIELDGTPMASYPWTGELEGGIDLNFVTTASDIWYSFSHWEVNNHVLTPDEFTADMIINLSSTDEIVAVYNEIPHFDLTVQVFPPLSGYVVLDDGTIVNDEWTATVEGGVPFDFNAYPRDYYTFDTWEARNHNAVPSNQDPSVVYTIMENDTIIANFAQEEFTMYLPNSFTPNNDGKNDVFLPIGRSYDVDKYELMIFNRWGEMVFHSTDPMEAWNGSFQGGEYYIGDEIFMFKLKVKPVHEIEEKVIDGHITVIR